MAAVRWEWWRRQNSLPGTAKTSTSACAVLLIRPQAWANVKTLHGPGFALLGNAAEFLDPVFSSGVTIAMRSASMAAAVLHRQLQGEAVDWQTEFAEPLKRGVDTFRCYVEGWYAGTFQDVIYHPDSSPQIRRMISAILAGYAWDERNPFVSEPKRRLRMLSDICATETI